MVASEVRANGSTGPRSRARAGAQARREVEAAERGARQDLVAPQQQHVYDARAEGQDDDVTSP